MANILYIEDEEFEYEGMVRSLRSRHVITQVTTGADALAELRKNPKQYELVLLDLMLPPGEPACDEDRIPDGTLPEAVGEFIYERMGAVCPTKPTILLTAVRSNMAGLRNSPTTRLLTKPIKVAELLHVIEVMVLGGGVPSAGPVR